MPNSSVQSRRNYNTTRRPRRRAPVACESCHARKVRCSLPQTGQPCANCSLDDVPCVPRENRRLNLGAKSSSYRRSVVSSTSTGSPAVRNTPERIVASEDLAVPTAPSVEGTGDGDGTETPYHPFNEHFSHHNGGSPDTSQPGGDGAYNGYSPIYGDPRGVGLVVDICEPEPREKSGHFLVPRISPTHLDHGTIDYLRYKGVFDLPSPAVCEMIIRTYFHYVHPFFPVVDARSFLDTFENARNDLSLHLLWSMFLAAANFADDSTLRAGNFASRKAMKHTMYMRAKALYDTEYERRKITLIQAVLLMGFWYSDTEDRTGPWHWNGVAIGLCQTIGLHRQPDSSRKHRKAISTSDIRLWRQIWWSCLYREAWFSGGMGRPMRINLGDCSTPMPDRDDAGSLLAAIPESVQQKYLPEGMGDLGLLWTELLALTVSLATILSWQNRAERTTPSRSEIQDMDDGIRQCYFRKDHAIANRQSHVVSLHAYHLELYLESVILILYRPFIFDKPEIPCDVADEWTSTMVRRTKDAATNTNKILGNMISADMISSTQAIVCIALVPALQIHLLETTSEKPLVQRMGRHNLQFCMMVLDELKTVYFGAEILSRMFTKAERQIYNRMLAPATVPRSRVHAPDADTSLDSTIDSTPEVPVSSQQDDVEIFDIFSTMLSPFAPLTTDGLFDNDGLFAFEPDITLE